MEDCRPPGTGGLVFLPILLLRLLRHRELRGLKLQVFWSLVVCLLSSAKTSKALIPVAKGLFSGIRFAQIRGNAGVRQFTVPISYTGFPAISIPCGFNSEGLPIGLQIVANDFQERLLFRIATAFEEATGFHEQHPAIYCS